MASDECGHSHSFTLLNVCVQQWITHPENTITISISKTKICDTVQSLGINQTRLCNRTVELFSLSKTFANNIL